MDLASVKSWVKHIQDVSRDHEVAHLKEDELYFSFVLYVREEGAGELKEMAKEVLKTKDIDFSRRCA